MPRGGVQGQLLFYLPYDVAIDEGLLIQPHPLTARSVFDWLSGWDAQDAVRSMRTGRCDARLGVSEFSDTSFHNTAKTHNHTRLRGC